MAPTLGWAKPSLTMRYSRSTQCIPSLVSRIWAATLLRSRWTPSWTATGMQSQLPSQQWKRRPWTPCYDVWPTRIAAVQMVTQASASVTGRTLDRHLTRISSSSLLMHLQTLSLTLFTTWLIAVWLQMRLTNWSASRQRCLKYQAQWPQSSLKTFLRSQQIRPRHSWPIGARKLMPRP